MLTVDYKKYKAFCRQALINCGVKEEAAEAVADCCVMTDMMGISTHGTVNLPKYINKMNHGGLNGQTTPTVITEGPTWVRLNGEGGFGMYNGRYAMDLAMQKADEMGMAIGRQALAIAAITDAALALALVMLLTGCAPQTPRQSRYETSFLDVFDTVTTIVGKAESEEARKNVKVDFGN